MALFRPCCAPNIRRWPFPSNNSSSSLKTAASSLATRSRTSSRPRAAPKDAEELARELVRKKKLTKFQAEEVYRGKGKSLVLGNYVLLEKIGAGGMGQVFKAEHRRMNRIVAIKLLPPRLTKDEAAIARFEREVTAAAKISHPNIVAAYDADQANGVHFLVMEFVEGSDLSALVKKNGPLPVEKAVNYILQAAKGLEAAHAEGIVHRDIKPANLLLGQEGDGQDPRHGPGSPERRRRRSDGSRIDIERHDHGDRRLHGPRTSPEHQDGRRPCRHLLPWVVRCFTC